MWGDEDIAPYGSFRQTSVGTGVPDGPMQVPQAVCRGRHTLQIRPPATSHSLTCPFNDPAAYPCKFT